MKKLVLALVLCAQACHCTFSAETLVGFVPGGDLTGSSEIVPSVDGERGRSGFSFAVEFSCPKAYDGPVVSKPGVFSLCVSGEPGNRQYAFKMCGRYLGYPSMRDAEIKVNAETDPDATVRLAGVCAYYFQPEQSRIGHILSLYLDGELIGSENIMFFRPDAAVREPVEFASGVAVRGVELGGQAFAPKDLFPKCSGLTDSFGDWGEAKTLAWKASLREVRFLELEDLVIAAAEKPVAGNPILGIWNRKTGHVVVGKDGLGWEVRYVESDGSARRLRSGSRQLSSVVSFREGGFVVTSSGSGFEVRHGVCISGGRIEQTLEVDDMQKCRIRDVTFPRVRLAKLPGKDVLVEPKFSGAITEDPTVSYQYDGEFPDDKLTLQFVCYYNDRGDGIYLGAEDPNAVTKAYTSCGGNGCLTLEFKVRAAWDDGESGARRFISQGRGILELYRGDWYDAGQIYRKFLQKSAPWYVKSLPRTDTPTWFMKNPIWIATLDLARSRLPAARYFAEYFEVPLGFVTGALDTGDGTGWLGPKYTVKKDFRECCRELQAEGMHFISYTNPRLWYCGPAADELNGYESMGKPWSMKREDGAPYVERYGPTDKAKYVVPCPTVAGWREYLEKRTRRVALDAGLDGIYHDQMVCGTPFACYDTHHGHLAADPSAWVSGGLWKFCDYLMGDLRRELPNLVHTSEESSEPFARHIDGFLPWRYGKPGHVPLFQSLYAPRIQFVGRGCDVNDYPGDYASFFPKYAEQLAYGEQIGWTSYPTIAYPSTRRGYLKKLSHCRFALADFLNSSEMERMLGFAEPVGMFRSKWGVIESNPVTVEKVIHAVWRHVDGRRLVLFLNVTEEPQGVAPVWTRGGKVFSVCRETSGQPEFLSEAPARVKLAPYGFEFWFVGEREDAQAVSVAQMLRRAARFPKEGRGAMLSLAPAFARTASTGFGRDVTPRDAAWGLLAYLPNGLQYENHRSVPAWKDGWIAALDGGLVNYGEVDFGEESRAVEMNLATDEKGVSVELFDMTGDVPERQIAEFRPVAGGWNAYRKHVSPLFGEVRGKRRVICRVTGGFCNLKNWKILREGTGCAGRDVMKEPPGKIDFTAMKKFDGRQGVAAADAAWTLFARKTKRGLTFQNGAYAYYGVVDFGKSPKRIEMTVASAESDAVVDVVDVSELAPSKPLARFAVKKGMLSSELSFKVEQNRNVVLMARGGACEIVNWKVLP